jgi:hypothetical protein
MFNANFSNVSAITFNILIIIKYDGNETLFNSYALHDIFLTMISN